MHWFSLLLRDVSSLLITVSKPPVPRKEVQQRKKSDHFTAPILTFYCEICNSGKVLLVPRKFDVPGKSNCSLASPQNLPQDHCHDTFAERRVAEMLTGSSNFKPAAKSSPWVVCAATGRASWSSGALAAGLSSAMISICHSLSSCWTGSLPLLASAEAASLADTASQELYRSWKFCCWLLHNLLEQPGLGFISMVGKKSCREE